MRLRRNHVGDGDLRRSRERVDPVENQPRSLHVALDGAVDEEFAQLLQPGRGVPIVRIDPFRKVGVGDFGEGPALGASVGIPALAGPPRGTQVSVRRPVFITDRVEG